MTSMTNIRTMRSSRSFGIGLLLVAAVLCTGIGATYGLSMHEASQENVLMSRTTSVEINEVFPDDSIEAGAIRAKEVSFTNTGTSAVFLRVAFAECWEDGGVWLQDDGTLCIKGWTPAWTTDWIDGGDGWHYYTKVLPAGGSTGDILSSVTFSAGLPPEYLESVYTLDFVAEAVQLSNEAVVNMGATQAVFGREAAVTITSTVHGAVTAGTVAWS
ncbi:MAG: hypothetical protein FWG03_02255 [Clostridiales bacterium]|nr:hypothetical protein [Clostridiales bacterium]